MYKQCFMCDKFLLYKNEYLDQEDAYEINEHVLCDDCVMDYIRKNCKIRLIDNDWKRKKGDK